MYFKTIAPIAIAILVPATVGFAQGADACANAQAISGSGTFAFDNTTATTDGSPDPLCYFFGTDQIDNDIWFDWTPPNSGTFEVQTCAQTAVDTKLGIYDGGCGGTVIACNDDACGLQTAVAWTATAGTSYLIRLGTFPGASGGTGTFSVNEDIPILNPDNGHYYFAVAQNPVTWDEARLAAEASTFMGVAGHLATLNDQVENDFVYAVLGGVNNHWVGGFQDLNDPNYSEPGGAWKWITGEPFTYTNWLPGEPNNMGAFPSEDFLELLDSAGLGQTWNDAHPMEHPAGYVIEYEIGGGLAFCFGDGTGTICPCGNTGGTEQGCANSSGDGATLMNGGSSSTMADDLTFSAANLLPGQPSLLFSGDNAINGGDGVVFGDGLRCAGQNVKRLGVQVPDANGDASWGPGLGVTGGWGAGDTRRFQAWYRDPNGSPCGLLFNLSHGVEILFGA